MARSSALTAKVTGLLPTGAGGTLGVFLGMMTDDALVSLLSGKSENTVAWTSFGSKAFLAAMLIGLGKNETAMIREGSLSAGSALLGTALFQLLVHLKIIS